MNCKYCKTIFKSASSLNNHLNKAKYCLLIQDKLKSKKKHDVVYKCEDCDKVLSTKQSLTKHKDTCSKRKDKESKNYELAELKNTIIEKDRTITQINTRLENYKEQLEKRDELIKDLQDKLDKIANKAIDRPTNSFTNTTTNNLNIMTPIDFNDLETIKDLIDNNLNANHVVEGQKGLVQFLIDTLLKDEEGNLKYKCTDVSRFIYKFLNIEGEMNKDVDAKKLISYIVSGGIKGKSVEIADRWYRDEDGEIDLMKYEIMNEPQKNILKIEEDSSSFRRELASMTSS